MHNIDSVTISSKNVDGQDVGFVANDDYKLTNTSNGDTSEITIDFKAGMSQEKLNALPVRPSRFLTLQLCSRTQTLPLLAM